MARFKKSKREIRNNIRMPEISMTPLIDTALTLLVIFMITAPIVQNGIKVDLPFGKSKEVGAQQELVVTLRKDEKMFFNSYPVTKETLVNSVRKSVIQREDIPVYVKADKSVPYGKVIEIVDQLKFAGVHLVAMSTRSEA